MEHLREMWMTAAGKSLKEMTKDEFSRLRVVYHGTSNPADVDKLLTQGVKMSNVPNNIGRQRFERGEYAEYQPGAGVGRGLYVTSSAYTASDYGRHVVAIEVTDADLAVPPESTVPGGSVAEALKDYNGAMIVRDIPASKVHLVAKNLTHYITEDVWETAQKVGARGEFLRGEAWARTTGDSMPRRSHAAVDYRKLVDALPSSYDQAIMSAMENAYDMGLREEADDDGDAFWYQVYGEVMA